MAKIMLRGFTNQGAAKAYFDTHIVESGDVDGILVKVPMTLSFRKDSGDREALGGGDELHLVMSYPKGTGTQIDSGVVPEEEPAEPQE